MTKQTENKMGVMPVGKLLFSMAMPMMFSMLVQAFYNVVDSMFVSFYSEAGFDALSLAFPLQSLMIAFGGGTMLGMNTLISKSLGRGDRKAADRAAGTGMFLSVLTAVVFALIGIFVSRPFFEFQTQNPEIVKAGISYTTICLAGSIGIFGQFCFERMLQATGRTGLATLTQVIGAVTNIILDPMLIFGVPALGIPEMGVTGAAYATIAGQILAALIGLFINIRFNPDVRLHFKNFRPFKSETAEIYKVGMPSIIMQSVGSLTTFTLNNIIGAITPAAITVYGAYFKLQSFIFMPIFGLNNGMVPIISYNYGAKKPERVKKAITISVVTAMSIMAVGYAVFLFAPEVLLGIFNMSDANMEMAKTCLRVIGLSFIPAGFCIITISVTQAIGNPFFSLITSACRQLAVLLPVAWLMSLTGKLWTVWTAFPIAEVVSLILSMIFLVKTMKKANREMTNVE